MIVVRAEIEKHTVHDRKFGDMISRSFVVDDCCVGRVSDLWKTEGCFAPPW